ncbi:hypothetical protein BV22DRAFT_801145 [Leucogyrophana mollusca]|uniref:Uncharacterized protein n=1 Tax=Leucogyrophana mollusca TaxID=85980 RepID=A0ACB8B5L2_9AGAM|nr:hypothetical protein BV22DRAFT_801145 [Leucogyrophana mollusca]
MKNTLNTPKNGVPICGNPQRQKTVLARTSQTSDPRAPKRQKLDLVETIASGSRLSNPPRPAQPDGVNATPAKRSRAAYNSDSEIQETSRPKVSKNPPRQSHPSTSAEILVIQDSDEDTGVHVSRPRSPSSPDPMLLTPNEHQSTEIHDFQTKPFKMQPRKKAKAREGTNHFDHPI